LRPRQSRFRRLLIGRYVTPAVPPTMSGSADDFFAAVAMGTGVVFRRKGTQTEKAKDAKKA